MIRQFEGVSPRIANSCYIDPSTILIGDIVIGAHCSVWPSVVIRADVNKVRIGEHTNIQDGSVMHVSHAGEFSPDGAELEVGDQVTIGHKALLHGCKIGNLCLIGMGSIVMDHAVIEDQVILGSGSMVASGKTLESGFLYLGNPVRKVRELTERETEYLVYSANHYSELKQRHVNSNH